MLFENPSAKLKKNMTFYEAKAVPYSMNSFKNEFFEFSKKNLNKIKEEMKKEEDTKKKNEEMERNLRQNKIELFEQKILKKPKWKEL